MVSVSTMRTLIGALGGKGPKLLRLDSLGQESTGRCNGLGAAMRCSPVSAPIKGSARLILLLLRL